MNPNDVLRTIAIRMEHSRREAGMSREQLARATSLTAARIADFESGAVEPSMSEFMRIVGALGVPASFLLPAKGE